MNEVQKLLRYTTSKISFLWASQFNFFSLSGLEPYSSEIFHLSAKMAEMVFRRYKKIFELLVFVTSKLLLLSGKKELLNDSDVTSLSHKMCEF